MHAFRTAAASLVLLSTVATGCDVLEGEGIGPEGGVIVSEDGRMALEVPPGALDEVVDITIEVTEGPQGAASDLYVVHPVGLVLEAPAYLVYDYDDEMVGGGDAETLTLMAHREADWAYLGDQLVDQQDQTVSASVMALSAVAVVFE